MTREPPRSPVEPRALDEGRIGMYGASPSAEQELFATRPPRALSIILTSVVDRIRVPHHREAVRLTVMEGLRFRDAAELMAFDLGRVPNPGTVYRWARMGLTDVAEALLGAPWMGEMVSTLPPWEEWMDLMDDELTARLRAEEEAWYAAAAEGQGYAQGDADRAVG